MSLDLSKDFHCCRKMVRVRMNHAKYLQLANQFLYTLIASYLSWAIANISVDFVSFNESRKRWICLL